MPRKPRALSPGYCYHITVRCNNREFRLTRAECRDVLLNTIKECQDQKSVIYFPVKRAESKGILLKSVSKLSMAQISASGSSLPYDHQLITQAKEMRCNPTPAEKKLWQDYLRFLPVRVLRQRPIDYFIVDFYCAALKLVIEVDGDSHFTEEGIAYDAERTRRLEGYNLKVLRFTNHEVLTQFEGVCQKIQDEIPTEFFA